MADITSANSIFMLAVTDLYDSPQRLQGYSADDAFTTDAVDLAEVVMGVDGRMSAGFTPAPIPMTISLMPDQPSVLIFDTWTMQSRATLTAFRANGVITLPSVGKEYTLTNGVLVRASPMPDARKVLQARQFSITWENITVASV